VSVIESSAILSTMVDVTHWFSACVARQTALTMKSLTNIRWLRPAW